MPGISAIEAAAISIADPNLEQAIRDALDMPVGELTSDVLDRILFLHADGREITTLDGIKHAESLTNLALGDNQITDISPLRGMQFLQFLSLWSNQISNISALAWLTSLQHLFLGHNQISNISGCLR